MARNNFTFEKRRRELDKKAKKEAKKQLKEENKARTEPGEPEADNSEADKSEADKSLPATSDARPTPDRS